MKLTFLGTRGYISSGTRRHRMHSSLLVGYYDRQILIDLGEDLLGKIEHLEPDAVLVTHTHPDHARGRDSKPGHAS